MSSDLAISVRDVGKTFRVAATRTRATTLGELLSQKLSQPFERRKREKDFEALRCVSFEVKRGAVLGIIGHNGAGKSTLLKILSQITPPTRGEIDLRGKVGALLEVGTGFHPELTGRENIYLNGAILGMDRREISRQFESIIAFAETEQFLDVPVKRYSSGMYVRLAFAVAAHMQPDILIVDEVLAVGDLAFQRKCLGKMEEISARDGRTVLFVSHQMAAVQQLCTECLLLEKGSILARGSAAEITRVYLDRAAAPPLETKQAGTDFSMELAALDTDGRPVREWRHGATLRIEAAITARQPMWKPAVDLTFHDASRRRLFSIQSDRLGGSPADCEGRWIFRCEIENPGFTIDEIIVDAGLRQGPGEYLLLHLDALRLGTDFASLPEGARTDCLLHPRLTHCWEEDT